MAELKLNRRARRWLRAHSANPAELTELPTKPLRGVEILSPGVWNGNLYTDDELQEMVVNFGLLRDKIRPPGKLGHDKGQKLAQENGYPAIGWVSNVYRKGAALIADFEAVPATVADLIEARAYNVVSSEIYMNLDEDLHPAASPEDVKYHKVLAAVAFLGADLPAVKDIKSISDVVAFYIDDAETQMLDYGDDLPPTTIGAALTQVMEQACDTLKNTLAKYQVVTDEEEDSIEEAYEQAEVTFLGALAPDLAARPVMGKLVTGMYSELTMLDDSGDDDDGDAEEDTMSSMLTAHDAYCAALEGIIKGKPGSRRIRMFMSTARRELASLQKAKTPFQSNTEEDMDLKKVAVGLGLPETATEAEVEAKLASLHTPIPTSDNGDELVALRQTVTELQAAQVQTVVLAEVNAAVEAGRLVPAQRDAMIKFATTNLADFRTMMEATPRMAFARPPVGSDVPAATADIEHPTPAQELVDKQLNVTTAMKKAVTEGPSIRELMEEHNRQVNSLAVAGHRYGG